MKTTRLFISTILSGLVISGAAIAQPSPKADSPESAAVMTNLRQKYPSTTIVAVNKTLLPGIFEVVMGKNVAYSDESGRYFLFGHLFDMETQQDLTEPKLAVAQPKVDVKNLPLKDSFVTVKGNGKNKLYVISDPDCPYCKQLEATLATLSDVTIYTFLFPIAQLHPEAYRKSEGVWCAKDQSAAWSELVIKGVVRAGGCETPIGRNIALAESLNISGTPTMIFEDGSIVPGAVPAARIKQLLAQKDGANK